jgi:hypothetical protein
MEVPAVDAITDFSEYSNAELYGMLNHLDPYKYPERVHNVEQEIERRLSEGEISQELIPSIDLKKLRFWR